MTDKKTFANTISASLTEESFYHDLPDDIPFEVYPTPKQGLALLDHICLIRISGEQSRELLQGQITQDINAISSSHSSLACCCSPKGRIISLFRIVQWQDDYLLLLPSSSAETLLSNFNKYAVFYKVEITDDTNNWLIIGSYDNQTAHTPATFNQQVVSEDNITINVSPRNNRFISLIHNKEKPAEPLMAPMQGDEAVKRFSELDWEISECLDGLPKIDKENGEVHLPHHLNLHLLGAISFQKGCYTGQEIIARMQYRGTIKKHTALLLAQIPNATKASGGILQLLTHDDKKAGEIVNVYVISETKALMLVIADDQLITEQQEKEVITLKTEFGPILKVLNLPRYESSLNES